MKAPFLWKFFAECRATGCFELFDCFCLSLDTFNCYCRLGCFSNDAAQIEPTALLTDGPATPHAQRGLFRMAAHLKASCSCPISLDWGYNSIRNGPLKQMHTAKTHRKSPKRAAKRLAHVAVAVASCCCSCCYACSHTEYQHGNIYL